MRVSAVASGSSGSAAERRSQKRSCLASLATLGQSLQRSLSLLEAEVHSCHLFWNPCHSQQRECKWLFMPNDGVQVLLRMQAHLCGAASALSQTLATINASQCLPFHDCKSACAITLQRNNGLGYPAITVVLLARSLQVDGTSYSKPRRRAVRTIQILWREQMAKKHAAALFIQKNYRMSRYRSYFLLMKQAALIIQVLPIKYSNSLSSN